MTKYKLNKLTPKNDISEYHEFINQALNDDDIKNIAITGDYGVGKSSILLSSLPKHNSLSRCLIKIPLIKNLSFIQQREIAHISFFNANENLYKEEKRKEISQDITLESLEEKIILNLIHQLKPKLTNGSKYKIKTNHITTPIEIFFLILSILMFKFETKIFENFPSLQENKLIFYAIVLSLFLFSLYPLINKIFYYILHLPKIKILFGEVQAETDNNNSHFDKNINEIVYLFTQSNIKTYVFEDLDRFNDITIFYKLKEINNLINASSVKPIKFFYVLKESIFDDEKKKTKFFDLIIPVVPTATKYNSTKYFIDLLNEVDKDYIKNLAPFCGDKRTIYNICNEYQVYKKILQKEQSNINLDKLFAMIFYKNLEHSDYEQLVQNEGILYELLTTDTIKENRINEIEDKYYISDYEKELTKFAEQYASEKVYPQHKHLIEEFILGTQQISIYINNGYIQVNFQQLKELLKTSGEDQKVKNKVIKIYKEKQEKEIKNTKLHNLINITDLEGNFKNPELMFILISNQYISNDYHNYISFPKHDLDQKDRFLVNLIETKNEKDNSDYQQKPNDIEKIIEELKDKNLLNNQIYNFYLQHYLLNNDLQKDNNLPNEEKYLDDFLGFLWVVLHDDYNKFLENIANFNWNIKEIENVDKYNLDIWYQANLLEIYKGNLHYLINNLQNTDNIENVVREFLEELDITKINDLELQKYTLNNKITTMEDVDRFLSNNLSPELQIYILELINDNYSEEIRESLILENDAIKLEIRKQIFLDNIEQFPGKDLNYYLPKLKFNENLIPKNTGQKPTVENNDDNQKILTRLKDLDLISSFNVVKKDKTKLQIHYKRN